MDPEERIRRLEAEVAGLRTQLESEPLAQRLSDALIVAEAASTMARPASHPRLLELVVETAASVISASAGALFLIDEEANELYFEIAFGGTAEKIKDVRVPLGHGIAGGTAVSGQALAVANVQEDPRWARDIGDLVGYKPTTLLCAPLFYEDRVIGVLELLDKQGAATFSADDVETVSLFANLAAVAIEQSRIHRSAAALVAAALTAEDGQGRIGEELGDELHRFGEALESDSVFGNSVEIAALLHDIVQLGEDEADACKALLRGFSEYVHRRRRFA